MGDPVPSSAISDATTGGQSVIVITGGSTGDVLTLQANGTYAAATPASGGVGGSTGSTDNRVLRADGTGGGTLQNSAVSIDDSGNVTGVAALTAAGFATVAQTGASGTSIEASGRVTTTFNTALITQGQRWIGTDGTTYWAVGSVLQSGNAQIQLDAVMAGSGQGRVNLGGGYLYLEGGPTTTGIRTFGALSLQPAALGGSGGVNVTGAITASGLICSGTYTVGTLPSAAANAYKFATVSDSSVTSFGGTVAGGGSSKVMVYSNGSNWTVFAI